MALTTAETLAHLAVNPEERLEFVGGNLETALGHVRFNLPVSPVYKYEIKAGRIFCQGAELSVDPEERGGVYAEGLQKALELAGAREGRVIFLYSPPGPVVFDENPENKYREIENYKFGQLYLLWKIGDKFENIAITTDEQTDVLLKALFPDWEGRGDIHRWFLEGQKDLVVQEIKRAVLDPRVFEGSIEDFIAFVRDNFADQGVYASDYSGKRYTGKDLSELIEKSVAGESLLPEEYRDLVEIAKRYVDYKTKMSGGLSREGVLKAYLSVYSLSPEEARELYSQTGYEMTAAIDGLIQERVAEGFRLNLAGACGGGSFDLGSLFGSFSPLESSFRALRSVADIDTDRYGEREFDCPTCGSRIRRPYNKLVKVCPHCEKEIPKC